jgi:aldehyde dehydrogenase (NAD+)
VSLETSLAAEAVALLGRLGVPTSAIAGGNRPVFSPITGDEIARVHDSDASAREGALSAAQAAFHYWRSVPAPRRGELVRLLGEELRAAKADLGLLVTLEAGKTLSEGLGEVQEMIDICDYAVGLSRQRL